MVMHRGRRGKTTDAARQLAVAGVGERARDVECRDPRSLAREGETRGAPLPVGGAGDRGTLPSNRPSARSRGTAGRRGPRCPGPRWRKARPRGMAPDTRRGPPEACR
jgi:hypothetical protein